MAYRTTRADVDSKFEEVVALGKELGALDAGAEYHLQGGNASCGVPFAILEVGPLGRSGESARFPHLGYTKTSAYAALILLEHAFKMVRDGSGR